MKWCFKGPINAGQPRLEVVASTSFPGRLSAMERQVIMTTCTGSRPPAHHTAARFLVQSRPSKHADACVHNCYERELLSRFVHPGFGRQGRVPSQAEDLLVVLSHRGSIADNPHPLFSASVVHISSAMGSRCQGCARCSSAPIRSRLADSARCVACRTAWKPPSFPPASYSSRPGTRTRFREMYVII
jgi:hypothetical protein